MNKGLIMATGDWLYFLGADDILLPNAFYNIFQKEYHADILYRNMFYQTGFTLKHKKEQYKDFKGIIPCYQSTLMRREIVKNIGGFNLQYKICADFELFQKLIAEGRTVAYTNTDVAIFNSLRASSKIIESTIECYRIINKYQDTYHAITFCLNSISMKIAKSIMLFILNYSY